MDFMKLLKSFEDFIFEAASWLIFYPLTLGRIMLKPLRTMEYSDREQNDDNEHRYDDALSPPLLLMITILLSNLISAAAQPMRLKAWTTGRQPSCLSRPCQR